MPPKKVSAKEFEARKKEAQEQGAEVIEKPVNEPVIMTGSQVRSKKSAAAEHANHAKPTKNTKQATKPKNTKAATKASSPADAKPKTNGTTTASKKRKSSEDVEEEAPAKRAKPAAPKANTKAKKAKDPEEEQEAPAMKDMKAAQTTKPKPAAKKPAQSKAKAVINHPPTRKFDVFVFGEGENSELGLGPGKGNTKVKRPRLNPLLSADKVGVVELACGGMHTAALTHDSKIYTWGVNDQGALGRDTAWEGGLKDMDDNNSDSDSDSDAGDDLNPHECTPTAIDSSNFPEGTVFTQLAAGDSCTFALTDEGLVYGWGTFRGNEGIMGFSGQSLVQKTPLLIPGLKKVVKIVCGENHVLALDQKGTVYAWGSGQQNQLGRRIVERTKSNGLVPREFGLPKGITNIFAGNNHSFAIHKSGKIYTWGLNSFGETGISENAGEDEAAILHPTVIDALTGKNITCMAGGSHHSIAVTKEGECLVWGRLDGYQCGLKLSTLPKEDIIADSRDNPRILKMPTQVPGINAAWAGAGSDHCIAITKDGKAFSWGFSALFQTGLGTEDDVEVATQIDNNATRDKQLVWAGAGGQFSVIAGVAVAGEALKVNGVKH